MNNESTSKEIATQALNMMETEDVADATLQNDTLKIKNTKEGSTETVPLNNEKIKIGYSSVGTMCENRCETSQNTSIELDNSDYDENVTSSKPYLKLLKEQGVENVIVKDFGLLPSEVDPLRTKNGRSCTYCGLLFTDSDICFSWECLEFCDTKCIENYQKRFGSCCACCQMEVSEIDLGKYCARFGSDIYQFCGKICYINYKNGFYMQESNENYAALEKERTKIGMCAVCRKEKPVNVEFSDTQRETNFCSESCFIAFKYENNIVSEKCGMCSKYYREGHLMLHMMNEQKVILGFCSNECRNIYIGQNRKIVSCCWCKVYKYNFDMIQLFCSAQTVSWCSLSCQRHYNMPITEQQRCAVCCKHGNMTYHIPSDIGLKSFCSYTCYSLRRGNTDASLSAIESVTDEILNYRKKQIIPSALASNSERTLCSRVGLPDVEKTARYIIKVGLADLPNVQNVATTVKPLLVNEETLIRPVMVDRETQTDIFDPMNIEVLPIPICFPQPIYMFNFVHIKAMPFALPVPVPILMPMTKPTTNMILNEVKDAHPTPSDPYEADLLIMAQLVADTQDTGTDDEQAMESKPEDITTDICNSEPEQDTLFGDNILEMILPMLTDLTETDFEEIIASHIIATSLKDQIKDTMLAKLESVSQGIQRKERSSQSGEMHCTGCSSIQQHIPVLQSIPEPSEPPEKLDANMCLKYKIGVNAWKQWVTNKNKQLEESFQCVKFFETDILQLTSEELNYSLSLFIKEVCKSDGAEYTPDTIYYLCLGVQQYLFENGRIDNIFCDQCYESFTNSLDDTCKTFLTLYNDCQYIITCVEEDHLWETKQLGVHSPFVLLNTLVFFNTKYFNLRNVDEHMQLSFSLAMNYWEQVPNMPGMSKESPSRKAPSGFDPPSVDGNRKERIYIQQGNEDNSIRCPRKLYEFYLSKCPENIKNTNDAFYLKPEQSYVLDSPVWYSTMPVCKKSLEKIFHRIEMVKEINVALLK